FIRQKPRYVFMIRSRFTGRCIMHWPMRLRRLRGCRRRQRAMRCAVQREMRKTMRAKILRVADNLYRLEWRDLSLLTPDIGGCRNLSRRVDQVVALESFHRLFWVRWKVTTIR